MSILLKQIFSFFKLLNSDTGHNSLAAGLALGIILGFSPLISLQALLVFLIVFFFRVQIGAAFLSAFFFKLIAFLIDPLADILGQKLLESPSLRSLWVELYNMPIIPFTRFNNSIVMGSALLGFIFAFIGFFIFRTMIFKYREHILAKIKRSPLWKAFAATTIYKWYSTYESLYGKH